MWYNAYELENIVEPLLDWFTENARELPWRNTKNPYHIWVSEIMLQQTRVEAVKPYYKRFLCTLESIQDLAVADEDVLHKLWEGLGYYNRVKNMKAAAIQIMENHNGVFPTDYDEIIALKGIGPYTAGAISSIAFSQPYPAVDGNVLRVVSRLAENPLDIALSKTKKHWEDEIKDVLPENRAGEFNQALMELGATVCLPNGMPKCGQCPLRMNCLAYQHQTIEQYPVKSKKKPRKIEQLNVFFVCFDGKIALRKRTSNGLLASLWELPNAPRDKAITQSLNELGVIDADIQTMQSQKHIFTHIEWHMECFFIRAGHIIPSDISWVSIDDVIQNYALPSAFRKTWEDGLKMIKTIEDSGNIGDIGD